MRPRTTSKVGLRHAGLAVLLLSGASACQRAQPPPAADCGLVAEALVSLEVGNYATVEERAAKLPVKRALCERQRITVPEAECLAKVTDTWGAGDCVPRMFPRAEAGDCSPVMAKIRAAIASTAGGNPGTAPMVEKVMAVLAESCAKDHWPESLRRCLLDAPVGSANAFSACEQATPPALKAKLEERVRHLAL